MSKRIAFLLSGQARTNCCNATPHVYKEPRINQSLLKLINFFENNDYVCDIFVLVEDFNVEKFISIFGERVRNIYCFERKSLFSSPRKEESELSSIPEEEFSNIIHVKEETLEMYRKRYRELMNREYSHFNVPIEKWKCGDAPVYQYGKLLCCWKILEMYQNLNNFEYDLVCRFRPDCIINMKYSTIFEDKENLMKGNYWIMRSDLFMLANNKVMKCCCNMYNDMYTHTFPKVPGDKEIPFYIASPEIQLILQVMYGIKDGKERFPYDNRVRTTLIRTETTYSSFSPDWDDTMHIEDRTNFH